MSLYTTHVRGSTEIYGLCPSSFCHSVHRDFHNRLLNTEASTTDQPLNHTLGSLFLFLFLLLEIIIIINAATIITNNNNQNIHVVLYYVEIHSLCISFSINKAVSSVFENKTQI